MDALFRRLVALIEWWAVLLLCLMTGVVLWGVFFRYALNSAPEWYDEFSGFLLVWLTFYGSVVVSYRGRHIGFELVVEKLGPVARRAVEAVAEGCVLLLQFVLFWYGWGIVAKAGDEITASLPWVKVSWIYSVIPISGALMLLISARRLVRIAAGKPFLSSEKEVAAWSGSSSE